MVLGGNCYVYDGTDENGNAKKYIISGADVVEYDGTLNPFNTHPILRKENTCERIYLFDDETKKSSWNVAHKEKNFFRMVQLTMSGRSF